ncbi:uncharacterized protein LOC115725287 [Cannabis sativa]|uniref:uncharacterized protein LOC115725287 n=1 Tax=Cannabis sativa TaxID=3483 RepID=UPI0029CA4B7D|nr:uncharacterized protein LOC115725287 [Cannabis sativa]XP_060973611.1 uncharacterized protein LOC115725287 [Cannabis sativa]XP_060973612.1 uncharacterized protein LOC115725287 [Cannabis sativa]XP_060973613.1 uncharacterized protein LOC115725287 [Cannabis sativa]
MLGISYGELFLLIGATAALVGPKDLPIIARTLGRFAGRSIGYVQLARGQFENVMYQSQARQVHKELQETMSQLEAIRHEIRSISFMNPSPLTRNLMDTALDPNNHVNAGETLVEKSVEEQKPIVKDNSFKTSSSVDLHSQATSFAKLAESEAVQNISLKGNLEKVKFDYEVGHFAVLPVSAESAGLLPNRKENNIKGSDIMLEAELEAEVAHNAKDFFSQPQNQLP